jgi:hypothetical protein
VQQEKNQRVQPLISPGELQYAVNNTSVVVTHVSEPGKTTFSTSCKNGE